MWSLTSKGFGDKPHKSSEGEDRLCANGSSGWGWTPRAGKCPQPTSPRRRQGQKSPVTHGSMACLLAQDKWGRDSLKPRQQMLNWIAPLTGSFAAGFEEKEKNPHAIQPPGHHRAPLGPPPIRHLFHSSQLSIKINSLVFRGLASIYLGREAAYRFVAVPESPCSTFLISEQSNQTR